MKFEDVVSFHGHACPGLALGYRVAGLALKKLGDRAEDEELVAVVENDSCSVDAIQVMLGCTFGKGNLIFHDYGKQVYTIIRRGEKQALRISVKWQGIPESAAVKKAWQDYGSGIRTPEIVEIVHNRKALKIKAILAADDAELFKTEYIEPEIPAKARLHPSLICDKCNEKVMASRIIEKEGRQFCIPCAAGESE